MYFGISWLPLLNQILLWLFKVLVQIFAIKSEHFWEEMESIKVVLKNLSKKQNNISLSAI